MDELPGEAGGSAKEIAVEIPSHSDNVSAALSTKRISLKEFESKSGFLTTSNDAGSDVQDVRHLYVHIPFCPKVCPYCSFYKEASDRNKTQGFLDSVLAEIDTAGQPIRCETIFFGGGTPSALSVTQLRYLLSGLRNRLDLTQLKEWTLEMNPATVSLEKAEMLRAAGVNRVSMGVQSWDPVLLERLGRVHTAAQAERSFRILRAAGYHNLNLDLIFGIPGQTLDQWMDSLRRTIDLGPEHVSAYCLTYEEDTEYFRKLQAGQFTPDVEADAKFFEKTMGLLTEAEYEQYEISNYAKPGYACEHNLAYWHGKDYLGLGPSAFSTIGNRRWQNVANTTRYVEAIQTGADRTQFSEPVPATMRKAESRAFGLRTNRGVPKSELEGVSDELSALIDAGYISDDGHRIRLTQAGKLVADSIAELLV